MTDTKIIGFDNPNEVDSDDGFNKNVPYDKKAKKKGSGAFGCMGLSQNVLKGIITNGYKLPTPIQRKTIPLALEGRDVVAMARTGSGKTACFLIPMLEKLKMRQPKVGARALILSPTRELALQTLKFIKSLAHFTDLRAAVVLGGDSMDEQFESIHNNPDILVATPGRFLHVCIEMDLKLDNVEYVVYDEADQLFEMGWGEQINEIANRLPESRQTLLISATLPKVLVEFAKAGLSDPVLIRLDVESKLPEELKLSFITCRPEEKVAVLLCLLKYIIKPDSQTIVFASTMHHVEYIHMILDHANITNTFIYSNLDSSARKINAAKFKANVVKVLVVTDVAARGIDIPHLDNVINFNFPAKSKLFVHRVGRCARAGRTGTAYNIVSSDEYAYLLDLNLFLGLPFNIVPPESSTKSIEGAIGKLPQSMIEQELAELITWHDNNTDLLNMQNVCKNAYQQYIRSRPAASTASIKRIKELDLASAGVHSEFMNMAPKIADLLTQMKSYRPRGTVFEVCRKPSSTDHKVMTAKREFHNDVITKFKSKQAERKENTLKFVNNIKQVSKLDTSTNDEISNVFKEVVEPKKRKIDDLYKEPKKKIRGVRDEEFYIPYSAPDKHTEDGLAVNNFATSAEREQMDLTGDNEDAFRQQKQMKKWDRKKKKMVTVNNTSKVGKIRTENGTWIPATYKTNRYQQWKEKSKIESMNNDDDNFDESEDTKKLIVNSHTHWGRHNKKVKDKMLQAKNELKRPEQILKQRKIQEKQREREQKHRGKGKGKGKGKSKSKSKGKGGRK